MTKTIQITGTGKTFVCAGVIVDDYEIIESAPILKPWIGKDINKLKEKHGNKISFQDVENKPILYEDIYEIMVKKNPVLKTLREQFNLDFA